MAERYDKETDTGGPTRGLLLYLLPAPLAVALVGALVRGNLDQLVAVLLGGGLMLLGARLTRSGLKAEAEFLRRKIATAPKTPRKTLGAICIGTGTFFIAWIATGNGLTFGLAVGILAAVGALLAYGADPRGEKTTARPGHGFSTEEIVAALTEAETQIKGIESASRSIHNTEMTSRLRKISAKAREILKVIEADPGDLRRARKFLNTYLQGAQRVTEGYAKTHKESPSDELETNFRNVLVTIEDVFTEQHEKLLANDVMDLDVQIEVLSNQLKREGVV